MQEFIEVFDENSEEMDEVVMAKMKDTVKEPSVTTEAGEPNSQNVPGNSATSDEIPQIRWKASLLNFAVLLLTMKKVQSLSESCIKAFLLFMVILIKILGTAFRADNALIESFLAIFPTSEHSLRTIAGIMNTDRDFTQLTCCPKCFKTYAELQT